MNLGKYHWCSAHFVHIPAKSLVLKRQTKIKWSVVPASPNFIANFYENNTEGTNFWIMLYVYAIAMYMFWKLKALRWPCVVGGAIAV